MKGQSTDVVIAVVIAVICAFAPFPPEVIEREYSTRFYPMVQALVTTVTNQIPIAILDVATILAQVRGDPVAAASRDDFRGAHRIGMIAPARVADRGHVVDIGAKAQPLDHYAARLPGLIAGVAASSKGSSSGE